MPEGSRLLCKDGGGATQVGACLPLACNMRILFIRYCCFICNLRILVIRYCFFICY